jgi:hypothetical protein
LRGPEKLRWAFDKRYPHLQSESLGSIDAILKHLIAANAMV